MFYLSLSNLYEKNFVKESDVKFKNIDDDKKNISQSRLSKNKTMSGEEIKKFYDDTINKISERNSNNFDKKKIKIVNIPSDNKEILNNNINLIKIDENKILKAVEQGDINYLKKYLNKENVNNIFDNYGWTPLMSAAYCGNKLIVEFLLKLNANKEYKNKCGLTALKLAKKKNFNYIIVLLENDKEFLSKNLNIKDNDYSCNFYCKICNKNCKETTVKHHEASIIHNLNKNFELPSAVNAYGLSKQNKGYKIMLNNGWDDRKGLGPTGTGFKYPVKTILKRDRTGLGKKPFYKPRITHFKSNDINAITHIKRSKINISSSKKILRKNDREIRIELS